MEQVVNAAEGRPPLFFGVTFKIFSALRLARSLPAALYRFDLVRTRLICDGKREMSPTLLELFVAILLVWLAWQLGVRIAPRLLAAFASFWRDSKPPLDSNHRPTEKNITPPVSVRRKPPIDP
jgi:hypothetical protein